MRLPDCSTFGIGPRDIGKAPSASLAGLALPLFPLPAPLTTAAVTLHTSDMWSILKCKDNFSNDVGFKLPVPSIN
jgi:hypothetical protein